MKKSDGKNRGNDFFERKITLPIIHAFEKSSEAEKNLLQKYLKSQNQIIVISTIC